MADITPGMLGTPGDLHVSDAPVPPTPTPAIPKQHDPAFLDPLVLEYLDGHSWRVVDAFVYDTDVFPLFSITVPAGFVTDFASVPRLLWNIFSPTGSYGKAAVIHDYLYRTPGIATKAEADAVFIEAMRVLGTGWFTRRALYGSVVLFGQRAYKGGL